MADQDPNELVYIVNPKVEAIGGPVTRQALDEVHSAKGWREASAQQVQAAEAGELDVKPTAKSAPAATN
jgi:hypothetical protein